MLQQEYAIRRLEENQPQSLVFLILDEEDIYHGKVEQHPEELCVSICFRGSHNEAATYYRKLTDYINKHKMQITGASREITMIDAGFTSAADQYVTQITIPVTEI